MKISRENTFPQNSHQFIGLRASFKNVMLFYYQKNIIIKKMSVGVVGLFLKL